MAGCTYEPWSMKDLTDALRNMHKDNKQLVVPMFQRGKRWKVEQEEKFIESLRLGYPVGTMLFYKKVENNQEIYMLVDGLQRGNTIKKYLTNPTKYFSKNSLPKEIVDSIFEILGFGGQERVIKAKITEIIISTIKEFNNVEDIEAYVIARAVLNELPTNVEGALDKTISVLRPYIKQYKDSFEEISKATIPVIVYSGDEDSLPDIFERINSKGTPLTQYEVYAASWPIDKKFTIENHNIVEKILRKYDSLADDDFSVYGYDRDFLRVNKKVNSFEYLFGLSKYLNEDIPFLRFNKSEEDDQINTMAFELVSACLNDGREGIKTLYKQILNIPIIQFEKRLLEAVEFVQKIITPVIRFKGNSRSDTSLPYSKFQVLSMIACTFREKYDIQDLSVARKSWNEHKKLLEKNMMQHFVYDIIKDEWSNGGTNKIYSVAKPNKYLNEIPKAAWESALNNLFENENMRNEKSKIGGVSSADTVFLNCIYLSTFTAMDQLSLERFDIEHIAPKEQMKKIIKVCNGDGVPVSSVANLCYLPEFDNRCKKDKNFYQDKKYLNKVIIQDVEDKYSFTKKEDLEWMDMPYQDGDYDLMKEYYMKFLKDRFEIQKDKFYKSMNIE